MNIQDNVVILPESNPIVESLLTTERLIQKAEAGEKLSVEDRRCCIEYLDLSQPHLTNGQLAEKFGVNESMIRKDKKVIESKKVQETFDTDVSLAVFKATHNIDQQIRALETSRAKSKPGTREFVMHCQAIANMAEKKLKILVDMGYVVKEVAGGKTTAFEYAAIVRKGDNIDTRPVTAFDEEDQKLLKAPPVKPPPVEPELIPAPQPTKREVVYVKPLFTKEIDVTPEE
jgi:hypothetical protein